MKRMRSPRAYFTDRYIKSLKPDSKMYQIREGKGFAIRVLPSGIKTWYYIYTFKGKRRQLNLGNYPETSLSSAHDAYREAVSIVKSGGDPQGPIDLSAEPAKYSVENLKKKYIQHIESQLVPLSVLQQSRTLENDLIPVIGKMSVNEVSRKIAISLIEDVASRAPGSARNLLKAARSMYSYAVMREIAESNPFSCVGRAVPSISPRSRTRILSDEEICVLWKSLDHYFVSRALFLILLTGQRPGEVVGMRWNEIENRLWIIPGERTKNRRDNAVYLSLASRLLMPSKIDNSFVFPAQGRGRGADATGHMRPGTLSHYITSNNYFDMKRWTPHDLRRTMATGLARLGCSDEIIDEILNHEKKGVISVYNRHRYDREKKKWLRRWSLHILSLLNGVPKE